MQGEARLRSLVQPHDGAELWKCCCAGIFAAGYSFKGSAAGWVWHQVPPRDVDVQHDGSRDEAVSLITSKLAERGITVVSKDGNEGLYTLKVKHSASDLIVDIELIGPSLHRYAPQLTSAQSWSVTVDDAGQPVLNLMAPTSLVGDAQSTQTLLQQLKADAAQLLFRIFRAPSKQSDNRSILKLISRGFRPAGDAASRAVEEAEASVATIDPSSFFAVSEKAPAIVRELADVARRHFEAAGGADTSKASQLLAGFGRDSTVEEALGRLSSKQLKACRCSRTL